MAQRTTKTTRPTRVKPEPRKATMNAAEATHWNDQKISTKLKADAAYGELFGYWVKAPDGSMKRIRGLSETVMLFLRAAVPLYLLWLAHLLGVPTERAVSLLSHLPIIGH